MKKTEEKKTTTKSTAAKTAAAKSDAVKPAAAKKASTKTAAKPAAKTVAKSSTSTKTAKTAKTAAKKTGRKPKPVTIDTICSLIAKKAGKPKFKDSIAVDIEVWGFEDGSNHKMYIELKDGNVSVMPHTYDEKDFRVSLSFANAMDFANGKLTLEKLLESKDFYAEGNIVAALKLASIF